MADQKASRFCWLRGKQPSVLIKCETCGVAEYCDETCRNTATFAHKLHCARCSSEKEPRTIELSLLLCEEMKSAFNTILGAYEANMKSHKGRVPGERMLAVGCMALNALALTGPDMLRQVEHAMGDAVKAVLGNHS